MMAAEPDDRRVCGVRGPEGQTCDHLAGHGGTHRSREAGPAWAGEFPELAPPSSSPAENIAVALRRHWEREVLVAFMDDLPPSSDPVDWIAHLTRALLQAREPAPTHRHTVDQGGF